MQRKLYIHIGIHKTGTTSIQWFLAKNRGKLLENGLFYPTVPETDITPFQHRYINLLIRGNKKDTFIKYFENAAKKSPNVLISSETFLIKLGFINWFKELKSIFDKIIIIVYVRQQDSWLESTYKYMLMYQQSLLNIPLQEWVKNLFNNKKLYRSFSNGVFDKKHPFWYNIYWYSLIKNWVKAFNRENVIIKEYNPNKFIQGSVVNDFMQIFRIDILDSFFHLENELQINSGPKNRNEIELYRITNKFISDKKVQSAVIKKAREILEPDNSKILSPIERAQILDNLHKSNTKLSKKYFNSNENIFSASNINLNEKWEPYKGLSDSFIMGLKKQLTDLRFQELVKYLENSYPEEIKARIHNWP